jgi:LmbE family N-acetylglucosaminyl deacetylase
LPDPAAAAAAEVFRGTVLVAAPHQDDCVLGCGGTIALLPDAARVHVVYATDGARSPEPLFPWRDRVRADLPEVRAEEARRALGTLGVPEGNVHFLGLPDGGLRRRPAELREALRQLVGRVRPDTVAAPFRHDRHPDHVALHGAVTALSAEGALGAIVLEYFVYQRWRLLPAGDVRAYVRPELLVAVDVGPASRRKRAALDCFVSQTTRFHPWQTRPNLTPAVLDAFSRGPEVFLRADPALRGTAVYTRARAVILVAHRLEPLLKRRKDQLVALLRRLAGRRG